MLRGSKYSSWNLCEACVSVERAECKIELRPARETSMRFPGKFFRRYFISRGRKLQSAGNHILSGIKNKRKLGKKLLQRWTRINGPLLADSIKCLAVLFCLAPRSPYKESL